MRRRLGQGGFSLAEMLAVLAIIAVLAAIATPGFAEMIRERRTQRETAMLAEAFRSARSRALGRGAAVAVVLDADPPTATIYEHVDANGLPLSSCNVSLTLPVDGDPWRQVEIIQGRPGSTLLQTFVPGDVSPHASVGVCYTPRGRSYFSTTGGAFAFTTQLRGVIESKASRQGWTGGQSRSILVMPNGQVRVSL
jgi:type IV fimbrial biogenesis protein FimT